MTLEITVRGSAESEHPAERGTARIAIQLDGPDKAAVSQSVIDLQDPMTSQLEQLKERGSVSAWSSDQLRVHSQRPWTDDGSVAELQHTARLEVRAEFADIDRLAGFIEYWSGRDGVQVEHIAWDVLARNRRAYETEIRKAAVDDAVHKAQVLANAARKGKVVPVQFADPGMLAGMTDTDNFPMATAAYGAKMRGGEQLDFSPRTILIRVEVDARFRAE